MSREKITDVRFKKCVGFDPIEDDLERCNCPQAGNPGHFQCGWDIERDMPNFIPGKRKTEKDGQIIVSELRDMSEAPMDCNIILVKVGGSRGLSQGHFKKSIGMWQVADYAPLKTKHLIGWIPMPIYQPTKPEE